jgi:hypothetical protein
MTVESAFRKIKQKEKICKNPLNCWGISEVDENIVPSKNEDALRFFI